MTGSPLDIAARLDEACARFTPGPWSVPSNLSACPETGAVFYTISSDAEDVEYGDTGIAEVPIGAFKFRDPRRVANAHLIAAAPELYEAVAEHLHAYDTGAKCCLDNLRAALAKARGAL